MNSNRAASLNPLLCFLCLLLTGCGNQPLKPPVLAKPEIPPVVTEPLSPAFPVDSTKHRILELLDGEWMFWGQQRVNFAEDEESIPHVGDWEDDDFTHSERVNHYWRSVGASRLSGLDCHQPWSAAFISWIMAMAGVSESLFPPARSHWVFLTRFVLGRANPDALFVPHTLREYQPKPGDLICASRGHERVVNPDELPVAEMLANTKLHCDIVIKNDGKTLEAIGGNVRNSVSKSILALSSDGHLQAVSHRQWFVIVENRLD
ncbi:MAG: DUF2272 domain-containing protein [Methylococcaceae bacterium]|nr:DUF2272 domain-containing protein [Methylococcaceae bacterium]